MSVKADVILSTCQECNWIAFEKQGKIILTDVGQQINELLQKKRGAEAMRSQIASMVRTYNWKWTGSLHRGREDALRRMPEDAIQCFRECGALDPRWPKNLISWWTKLNSQQRNISADENFEVGQHAEELSFEYENGRVGKRPQWRSLESESDGYDILSQLSRKDRRPLRIEVKGTSVKTSNAEFSVTRNQWRKATRDGNYVFHLWALGQTNVLSIVNYTELEPHVPADRNKGTWQSFRIKFGYFFADARRLVDFQPTKNLRTPVPKKVQARILEQIS